MNRRHSLKLLGTVSFAALMNERNVIAAAPPKTANLMQTKIIFQAAARFIDLLDGAKSAVAVLPYTQQANATAAHFKGGMHNDVDMVGERYGASMWSNFPVSDVPRPGIRLGSLDDAQRSAAMALVRAMLSDRGYRKVLDIMGADQVLADSGTPYASGRDAYTLAIFGTPAVDRLWMVQFGGHHLALNLTMLGERGVLAPVLTGALPASYQDGGVERRALAAENDLAFALFNSLDEEQRKQATIDHPVSALVLGPGHDGEAIEPEGIKAAAFDARQRAMLFDLIAEWAGIVNDAYAAPRLAEIRQGLDQTFFAWSGPATRQPDRNGSSYFRIQGPSFAIGFSPQEPGGDLTMHVHTIYRDHAHAYGRNLA